LLQFAFAQKEESDFFDGVSFSDFVKVNALIGADDANPEKTVSELISLGFETVKMKIGAADFEDDLRRIELFCDAGGGKIKLRLDANGKWDRAEAENNLETLSRFNIEYIEEPVSGLSELIELADTSPIPIAVDESLKSFGDAHVALKAGAIKYFVVKPARFGSLIELFEFISAAEEKGKVVVVSSSLETVVGKSVLAFAAAATNNDAAHGLGIVSDFTDAMVANPFPVKRGRISLDNFPHKFTELERL
jgi:O-succinylbenzoate synthase